MVAYSKYQFIGGHEKRGADFSRTAALTILFLTTTVLAGALLTEWVKSLDIFLLKKAEVEGNRFVLKAEALKLAQLEYRKNIFQIDTRGIADKIKNHPLVKDAHVNRRPPASIVIHITEREPLAVVNAPKLTAVDEGGKSLPKIPPVSLRGYPVIADASFDPKNPHCAAILNFLRYVKTNKPALYHDIAEISFSKNHGIHFQMKSQPATVYVGESDYPIKSAKLITAMSYLEKKHQLSHVEYFDVRFKNQVVVKATEKI
jgi:cell division protein FtsQ